MRQRCVHTLSERFGFMCNPATQKGPAAYVSQKVSAFFAAALNLCLIHDLGTRQNGSLLRARMEPRRGPTSVRRGRVCSTYVAVNTSRSFPMLAFTMCNAIPRATP
jgi:hypothetical protein